jgi:hypothetical protein
MRTSRRIVRHALPRQIGTGLVLAGLAFATSAGVARNAEAIVPRGDAAARLPAGALASESWDVVAHFESGHVLVATMALFNPGLGARNALAFGQLIEPDGTLHRFSRSERAGGWHLDPSGRRVDLRSIVLDQSRALRHFVVDKNELGIEVAIETLGAPAWPADEATSGCALDVLEVAGPATGSFRIEGREAVPLRGLAALTHRWTPGLEASCWRRGVELFAMQDGLGLYLRETETPTGERRTWLVLQRAGVVLFQGAATDSDSTWRAGPSGYPDPLGLEFRAPGVSGRIAFGDSLGRFDPLARLPSALRLMMERRTRPRLQWSESRVELTFDGHSKPAILGDALARFAWSNPTLDGSESLSAAGDPAPRGE